MQSLFASAKETLLGMCNLELHQMRLNRTKFLSIHPKATSPKGFATLFNWIGSAT